MAESTVWHQEQKTKDWTEYYAIITDGDQTIPFILKYNAAAKEVRVDPYSPPDINYTIHDSCDHENDDCVLDDPESFEAQDVAMAEGFRYAADNLKNLEAQLKQQRIAERLISKKQSQQEEEK